MRDNNCYICVTRLYYHQARVLVHTRTQFQATRVWPRAHAACQRPCRGSARPHPRTPPDRPVPRTVPRHGTGRSPLPRGRAEEARPLARLTRGCAFPGLAGPTAAPRRCERFRPRLGHRRCNPDARHVCTRRRPVAHGWTAARALIRVAGRVAAQCRPAGAEGSVWAER